MQFNCNPVKETIKKLIIQKYINIRCLNAWHAVANNLFIATGFVATAAQCRNKQNALKRGIILFLILFLKNFSFILTIKSQLLFFLKGYENLQRIITNNSDGFPLASSNNFDHACCIEMSDHFWGSRSNYFIYFKIEIVIFYLNNLLMLFIYILAYFRHSY